MGLNSSGSWTAAARPFLLGLGVGATLWPNVYTRLEYQTFRIDDELLGLDTIITPEDDATFDSVNLEVHYRFGKRKKKRPPIEEPPERRRE